MAARAAIGLGETGYGSAGAALIASCSRRIAARHLLGGFLAAVVVGSVLGVVLGGMITRYWGWQVAFGVVGIPGLVLALAFLLVRDYRTVPLIDAAAPRMGAATVVKALFNWATPAAVRLCRRRAATGRSFDDLPGCQAISTASTE